MSFFQLIILIVITYICVYSILDRICTCREKCSLAKSYEAYVASCEKKETKGENKNGPF